MSAMTRVPQPGPAESTQEPVGAPYLLWLAVMAIAYGLTHHIGFGLARLGTVGETRWADWIDILTPYVVLLPAAAALRAGGAGRRAWVLYLIGAFTYVEGHGVHLSANSVGNVEPSDVVHLWDEVVGHYLWYGGLILVVAALAVVLAARPPVSGPVPVVLALLTGVTFTTNSLEGGTALLGIGAAAGFGVWGWATRDRLGRLLLPAFVPALITLAGYGIWHRGFPQPSDLGWV
jgi:hypothetical protein